MNYPERHPHGEAIQNKKSELDQTLKNYREVMDLARASYVEATASLREMGKYQEQAIELLKEIGDGLSELEEIVSQPLLP